jgi:hypothetical protein
VECFVRNDLDVLCLARRVGKPGRRLK